MDNGSGHVGPEVKPAWWDLVRQMVLFVAGVWLIIYAALIKSYDIVLYITGLVLIGMVSAERLFHLDGGHSLSLSPAPKPEDKPPSVEQ